VFDHPPEFQVPLTALGLPFRAGEPVCKFYKQNNACKFGPACKFHHPPQVAVYAGSALLESPDG
jgi:serine/threonine-protein kinase/endoribonuclease IRE1